MGKKKRKVEGLQELKRELTSLQEFENERHSNKDVRIAVQHRILSLQIQISRLDQEGMNYRKGLLVIKEFGYEENGTHKNSIGK